MIALRRISRLFAFLSVLCLLTSVAAEEITVAAAADLQFAFKDIATRFEKDTGNSIKLVFGSSGNFTNQIKNGAPFDMFFSADIGYPRQLETDGLVEPGTLYHYANGKIVLWARQGSTIAVDRGLKLLLDPAISKIAIANPQHAPYGRAAVAALHHEGISEQVQHKLVLGENISQAAQFVETGNAEVGIVALSLVLAPAMQGKGKYWLIPESWYPAIEQGCVILKSSHHKKLAQQFLAYWKKPETVKLMQEYGFVVPKAATVAN